MVNRSVTPFEVHHRSKLFVISNKAPFSPLTQAKNFPYAVNYAGAILVILRGSFLNEEMSTLLLGMIDGCHGFQSPST